MPLGSTPRRIRKSLSPGSIRLLRPQLHVINSAPLSWSVARSCENDSHAQRVGFQVRRYIQVPANLPRFSRGRTHEGASCSEAKRERVPTPTAERQVAGHDEQRACVFPCGPSARRNQLASARSSMAPGPGQNPPWSCLVRDTFFVWRTKGICFRCDWLLADEPSVAGRSVVCLAGASHE